MEWRPAGWSVCVSLLIFPCTIKSRSSVLVPAHLVGPGKKAVKRLWCVVVSTCQISFQAPTNSVSSLKIFFGMYLVRSNRNVLLQLNIEMKQPGQVFAE